MKGMWIVVADGSVARLHSWKGRGAAPALLEELLHKEGRLHSSALVSDRPGQAQGDGGRPHGLAQRESAADHERERFARRIAAAINAGLANGDCKAVALVMAPKMLGLVRAHLSLPARQALVASLDRRLVGASIGEVMHQLSDVLPPAQLA